MNLLCYKHAAVSATRVGKLAPLTLSHWKPTGEQLRHLQARDTLEDCLNSLRTSLLTTEETSPSAENINEVIQELSGLKNQAWAGAR
jgi:hypothetical protein